MTTKATIIDQRQAQDTQWKKQTKALSKNTIKVKQNKKSCDM